jgi:hypothetical protein
LGVEGIEVEIYVIINGMLRGFRGEIFMSSSRVLYGD